MKSLLWAVFWCKVALCWFPFGWGRSETKDQLTVIEPSRNPLGWNPLEYTPMHQYYDSLLKGLFEDYSFLWSDCQKFPAGSVNVTECKELFRNLVVYEECFIDDISHVPRKFEIYLMFLKRYFQEMDNNIPKDDTFVKVKFFLRQSKIVGMFQGQRKDLKKGLALLHRIENFQVQAMSSVEKYELNEGKFSKGLEFLKRKIAQVVKSVKVRLFDSNEKENIIIRIKNVFDDFLKLFQGEFIQKRYFVDSSRVLNDENIISYMKERLSNHVKYLEVFLEEIERLDFFPARDSSRDAINNATAFFHGKPKNHPDLDEIKLYFQSWMDNITYHIHMLQWIMPKYYGR